MNVLVGILLPFVGTTLGSFMVYFMKNRINKRVEKILLGFASGVMLAASVWSLLIPAMEMSLDQGVPSWIPAAVGFLLGIFFLLLLDNLVPHLHLNSKDPEGVFSKLSKNKMLLLGVVIHNIPEGMAIGVVFAGFLSGGLGISLSLALALSMGIAIQNFPEGAIISMPLKESGMSKNEAFIWGMLSGVVEPIAAIITICLTGLVVLILPYLLSFAAGAMIYVVVEELIPEYQNGKHTDLGTVGLAIGFVLMMILDVALG